jgi:hypothetical protein
VAIDKNAAALARKLPTAPDFKLLAGAGHFVFMAPCNDEQIRAMPALCTDADGVDREDIHRNLISEAGRFLAHAGQAEPGGDADRGSVSDQAGLEQAGSTPARTDNSAALKKIHAYPRFSATAPINGPAIASARSKTPHKHSTPATAGVGHLLDRLDAQRRVHQRQAKAGQPGADQGERGRRRQPQQHQADGFDGHAGNRRGEPPKRLMPK